MARPSTHRDTGTQLGSRHPVTEAGTVKLGGMPVEAIIASSSARICVLLMRTILRSAVQSRCSALRQFGF